MACAVSIQLLNFTCAMTGLKKSLTGAGCDVGHEHKTAARHGLISFPFLYRQQNQIAIYRSHGGFYGRGNRPGEKGR